MYDCLPAVSEISLTVDNAAHLGVGQWLPEIKMEVLHVQVL